MKLWRQLNIERGAALVEYTPILALFLLIALPSIKLLGEGINKKFCIHDIPSDSNITCDREMTILFSPIEPESPTPVSSYG